MMNKLLLLLIILLISTTAKADCMACWYLRKVEIVMNTGDTLTGFVRWNESWIVKFDDWNDWKNMFPSSLLHYHNSQPSNQNILVIKNLSFIRNDSLTEFKAALKSDTLIINSHNISSITKLDNQSEKYSGAGGIPVYSQTELDMLNGNPHAIYHEDVGVADVYLLSYNDEISKEMLGEIMETNYWGKREELRDKGVLIVILSYD